MTGNLKDFNRVNDLGNLNMPVLITCGRFDEATPQSLQKVSQKLPNGQLVVFEKSAHLPHLKPFRPSSTSWNPRKMLSSKKVRGSEVIS